jgi:hypothetical protein
MPQFLTPILRVLPFSSRAWYISFLLFDRRWTYESSTAAQIKQIHSPLASGMFFTLLALDRMLVVMKIPDRFKPDCRTAAFSILRKSLLLRDPAAFNFRALSPTPAISEEMRENITNLFFLF